MAEPLSMVADNMSRSIAQLCLALAMLAAPTLAAAEDLPDPTRPPASIALGADGAALAPPSGPVLQSVLISPGRTMAIISGRSVKLGDRVGDATVTAIREGEVELRSGKNIKTLRLFPGIEKRLTSSRTGAKPDRLEQ